MLTRDVLLLIAALAFLPPLAFVVWVRNQERHQREPLSAVLGLFLYAGTLGIALAFVLDYLGSGPSVFWTAVVVAPMMEELCKGAGLGFVQRRILEPEDGLVYGAALGLGFAATENFFYALTANAHDGVQQALVVLGARMVSSLLLHSCSTAMLGFGYARMVLRRGSLAGLLPYYLVAVLLHAAYNDLVFQQTLLSFVLAVAMVAFVAVVLRRRLQELDAKPPASPPVA